MYHALMPLILLLAAPPAQDVGTGPEPAARPISWELEFKFQDPRRLEIQLPGSDRPEVYWYMLYTVVNTSPHSQRFFPLIQLGTEDLKVHDTDNGISALVFDEIKARHQITHKYLVHPTRAIGALLTGDDNARESVAIWRDVDLSHNRFTIYVGGLSGETRLVLNPAFDPQKPETPSTESSDGKAPTPGSNPKYFTLRKTLEIPYNLPGSPQARERTAPERGATRWIMR
jgi:hypothetical protein